jgi:hypothetical protein
VEGVLDSGWECSTVEGVLDSTAVVESQNLALGVTSRILRRDHGAD